jgi:hypothetical protein
MRQPKGVDFETISTENHRQWSHNVTGINQQKVMGIATRKSIGGVGTRGAAFGYVLGECLS